MAATSSLNAYIESLPPAAEDLAGCEQLDVAPVKTDAGNITPATADADARLRNADARLRDADARLRNADARLRDADARLRNADARLRNAVMFAYDRRTWAHLEVQAWRCKPKWMHRYKTTADTPTPTLPLGAAHIRTDVFCEKVSIGAAFLQAVLHERGDVDGAPSVLLVASATALGVWGRALEEHDVDAAVYRSKRARDVRVGVVLASYGMCRASSPVMQRHWNFIVLDRPENTTLSKRQALARLTDMLLTFSPGGNTFRDVDLCAPTRLVEHKVPPCPRAAHYLPAAVRVELVPPTREDRARAGAAAHLLERYPAPPSARHSSITLQFALVRAALRDRARHEQFGMTPPWSVREVDEYLSTLSESMASDPHGSSDHGRTVITRLTRFATPRTLAEVESRTCPICLESVAGPVVTDCVPLRRGAACSAHVFCGDCMRTWTHTSTRCPLCRENVHCLTDVRPLSAAGEDDTGATDAAGAGGAAGVAADRVGAGGAGGAAGVVADRVGAGGAGGAAGVAAEAGGDGAGFDSLDADVLEYAEEVAGHDATVRCGVIQAIAANVGALCEPQIAVVETGQYAKELARALKRDVKDVALCRTLDTSMVAATRERIVKAFDRMHRGQRAMLIIERGALDMGMQFRHVRALHVVLWSADAPEELRVRASRLARLVPAAVPGQGAVVTGYCAPLQTTL